MKHPSVAVAAIIVFGGASHASAQQDTMVVSLDVGTYVCETEADARRAAEAQQTNTPLSELQPAVTCRPLSRNSRAQIVEFRTPLVAVVQLEEDPGRLWYLPHARVNTGLVAGLPDGEAALAEKRLQVRAFGEQEGKKVRTEAWFGVGLVVAGWMPLIGVGIAVGVAGSDKVQPVLVPAGALAEYAAMGPSFEEEFRKGFRDAALEKRRSSALLGGLTSTALLIALIIAYVP